MRIILIVLFLLFFFLQVIVTMIISIVAAVLAILGVLYTGVMAAQFHYKNFQFCSYDYDEDGKREDCRNDYSKVCMNLLLLNYIDTPVLGKF